MRFSEVFLRLGCSLVSWMVLYAHFLWLALVGRIGCGPDGDEVFRVLLGLVPLTVGLSFLLSTTRPLEEIHKILRWLGAPLVLLLPFIVLSIWKTFNAVVLIGDKLCSTGTPQIWEQAWAPAQLIAISLALLMMLRMWRPDRTKIQDVT